MTVFVCSGEAMACFSILLRRGQTGADYIPGINKYHEKVTFPSVICATSKSNYMENVVREAVCVFSLSKQRFQRSFYTHLWTVK